MNRTPVAVDISKSVFQCSFGDAQHRIHTRRRLSRGQFMRWLHEVEPVWLIMEGCGSCHYWARTAQSLGHQVTLLHAKHVQAYVRGNKTDAADADGLMRAAQDVDLQPLAIKSEEHQALQSLHRVREQWQRARVARINEARGLLAEFGIVVRVGAAGVSALLNAGAERVPVLLRATLHDLVAEVNQLQQRVKQLDRTLKQYATQHEACGVLLSVPGVGITIATAAIARVGDIHRFPKGRSFANWLGLTTQERSSGKVRRLGRMTKRGDVYLRTLLIHGARSALLATRRKSRTDKPLTQLEQWTLTTEQRIGHNKAAVALANKMARILWAVWSRRATFDGNNALRYAA